MVWVDPGGTTHNYAVGHRSQLLNFVVSKRSPDGRSGVLTVRAPSGPTYAPPGFYMVFLVSGEQYSKGTWVQIREPAPTPIRGVMDPYWKLVPKLSASWEKGSLGSAAFRLGPGSNATGVKLTPGSAAARAGGARGLRLELPQSAKRATLLSTPGRLEAWKNCQLALWVRAARPGTTLNVNVVPAAGGAAAMPPVTLRLQKSHCFHTLPVFTPKAGANYSVRFEVFPGGQSIDFDDVELYCSQ